MNIQVHFEENEISLKENTQNVFMIMLGTKNILEHKHKKEICFQQNILIQRVRVKLLPNKCTKFNMKRQDTGLKQCLED